MSMNLVKWPEGDRVYVAMCFLLDGGSIAFIRLSEAYATPQISRLRLSARAVGKRTSVLSLSSVRLPVCPFNNLKLLLETSWSKNSN